jgi:predicted secreted Zn-dependent protease
MSYMQDGNTSLTWRTALNCNGGTCVKVAATGHTILVGDSKTPNGPVLTYSPAEWREFVAGVKNGDFDDLIE